jgi:ABC-type glycerol-3-phosphate transport system substrate-binding protein
VLGIAALVFVAGCGGDSSHGTAPDAKPFSKVVLTVRCPDPALAAVITPATRSWADRTGAGVTIHAAGMTPEDDTDVGIIAAPELGVWADRGALARVPAGLGAIDHPFQWTGVLPAYRQQLIEWGGQAQAVPLVGDGFVIVYRADRFADAKFIKAFQETFGRKPAAPATWEEFADLATAFATLDGRPSLPSYSGAGVADLFFRVAACYNRSAMTDPTAKRATLSFEFDLTTGAPRLDTPAFVAAADWLARLAGKKCFPPLAPAGTPADPVAALDRKDAPASLAVVSLAQLARLPREGGVVPARFAVAALPGTQRYTDPEKGTLVTAAVPNYVPYFAGGRIGVVRARCQHQAAAFDLLADLGGPTRSLEVVSTPGLGAGPFRVSHLERDRIQVWYGYGFDADRTKQLQDALRQYVRQDVKAPVFGLRGPDREPLSAAAAAELGKLAEGVRPDAVLKQLTAAWNAIDEKTPQETRLRWRKMAAGVN